MTKHTLLATFSTLSVVTMALTSPAAAQAPAAAPAAAAAPAPVVAPAPVAAPAVAPAPVAPAPVAPAPVAQAPDPDAVVAAHAPGPVGTGDPNADRGFLLPTAMTQPAGSITYNNYELLLHGLTYGITDNVQATMTVLAPIVEDMPFVGFGSVKGRLPIGNRLQLALQGSVGVGHFFETNEDNNTVYTVGAGAFVSVCLYEDCSSIASASATTQVGLASGNDNAYVIIYGGSIVHRVASNVKLLLEIASAAGGIGNSSTENMPGFLASYGVRLHTGNMAADLGFIRPFGEDTGDFLMGLPFASISYRWQ